MKQTNSRFQFHKGMLFSIMLLLCQGIPILAQTQQQSQSDLERVRLVRDRLNALSVIVPGLKQKVQMNVSGVSAQEFLRALAQANKLNINIDPQLNFKIFNNFSNETALNVLVFLCKEYDLNISLVGSIMSVLKNPEPKVIIPVREINAGYDKQNNTLSLDLANDTLSLVARKITQISGKNIIVPTALLNRKVTAFFSGAPFETALEKLAFSNELKLTRTNDNVYVFQALTEDEEVYINADKNTSVRRNLKPVGVQSSGNNFRLQSRMVAGKKLLSIDAQNVNISDVVKAAAQEVNADYILYSDIKGGTTMHVNDLSYEDLLTAVFNGTDYTYRLVNGRYMIGDRKTEGLRGYKIIQLQSRALDTIKNMIPEEWRKGVEIKEFKEQNSILLTGSTPQINEIEAYLRKLDKTVPMVLIELIMYDIRKGKSIKTGIAAGTADSIKTGGTVFPGLDYTFGARSINSFLSSLSKSTATNLGRVTPNFYVSLSALENNSNVDILSVPRMSTLNGHNAKLSVGNNKYYTTTTQNVIGSLTSQTVVTQQFTAVEANMDIDIRPIVSGDDQVTLNIKIKISDFVGDTPPNQPPPTSTSKYESIIRAKNEDMIVLGGIERTESAENGSGLPVLSRIPILKWLFSSRSKSTNKVVTVVFIKPRIIY